MIIEFYEDVGFMLAIYFKEEDTLDNYETEVEVRERNGMNRELHRLFWSLSRHYQDLRSVVPSSHT